MRSASTYSRRDDPHRFLQLYLSLSSSVRKVADLVGVTERFLVKASHSPPAYQSMDHVWQYVAPHCYRLSVGVV